MLNSRFSPRKEVVRSGPAAARSFDAAPRLRWNGCAARANGRTFFSRIGAASSTKGSTAALASSSLRTGGRSNSKVGRICFASVSTLPSVVVVWSSVPGSFDTRADVLVLVSEGAERDVRPAHEPGDVLV